MLIPGMSTLETGCGHTTAVFSIAGTNHICITPDAEEVARIKQYCAGLGLAQNVTFLIDSSDKALPCSTLIPAALDVIIIDGAHRFPFPIIDWHYTTSRLKLGGVVCLDDFNMPSVRILHNFLCVEEEWQLINIMHNTAFFRKINEQNVVGDWKHQKINLPFKATPEYSKAKLFIEKWLPFRVINARKWGKCNAKK
jgi:hypothetical protein